MIKNIKNSKLYIGQSTDIKNRWMRHKSELNNNRHINNHLQSAWNKYGEDCFVFAVIEECSVSELDEREKFYISKYNSMSNGYNLCEGGNGIRGYKHTEEEIEKMRMIQNPKTLLQINKNLEIVNKWHGISHASKTLGYSRRNIELCCNMVYGHKTAYGYYWFYEDDFNKNKIDWNYYVSNQKIIYDGKCVVQKDLNGNILSTFKSIMEAHRMTNINRQSIQYCLQGKQKTAKNYIFEYI